MKISKAELIEMRACGDGLDRFIKQTNNTDEAVDVVSLVGGENTYDDLLWLACEIISKPRILRFAKDCALINIELIKPYCSDEQYNAITHFLNGDDNADKVFKVDVYQKKYNTTPAGAQTKAGYAAYCAARTGLFVKNHCIARISFHAALAAQNAAKINEGSINEVNRLLIDLFNEVE